MKEFFKYTLATVVGILFLGLFSLLMSLLSMGIMMASGDEETKVKDGSVLRLSLSGILSERASEDEFASMLGIDNLETQGLDNLLAAVREAATNKKVSGIYLDCGALEADFAQLQELRKALLDFKKSKKFIVAYGDTYTQGTYYVASVADRVYINPEGLLDWHGIASQPIFYTDLLKKVGVKMQVFKVGTFKSAVEPYILTGMSEANRLQVQAYISDIWNGVCADVSASRKVKVDSLNAYADRYAVFAGAKEYVRMGLADSLAYVDGVRSALRTLSKSEKVTFVKPSALAKAAKKPKSDNTIAVYYAEGDIVDNAAAGALGGNVTQIVGKDVVKDLDELANDDDVKAVVLRVNSGGGSAYASEQMWHAVQLLKQKKPVVVSMSGLAASGGYYLSCGADYIVADAGTLTGSIGIFGMIPDFSELMTDKLGLHFDVVKTNAASDFGAMGRGFNPAEGAALQGYVNRGYALFLRRVADGRGMKPADVDKIAQGRVWTGSQALKIKLVDKLGTLDDAIAVAASRAKLSDYKTVAYPAAKSWMSKLLDKATKNDYMETRLRTALGEYYAPLNFVTSLRGRDCLQARIPYAPNIK